LLQIELNRMPPKGTWGTTLSLKNLPPSFLYVYYLDGANGPIIDPFATWVVSTETFGRKASLSIPLCSGWRHPIAFDWEEDRPPNIAWSDLLIYEMHVRSFTKDTSSKVENPGTYLGIVEKLPYLQQLGINAIELMPIFEFDETEYRAQNGEGRPLVNMWGYSPLSFFCPMSKYASVPQYAEVELKTLVKALHASGIEVILDVVYNHTGEAIHGPPYFSLLAIDPSYFLHTDSGERLDYTGTGSTLHCGHPYVMELILSSLRFWVEQFHIDGFRFDLASSMTRDQGGQPLDLPILFTKIAQDPLLSRVKCIMEPWDMELYQLGKFPAWGEFAEWNGNYRDSVRRFLKGTDGYAGAFAHALCGSQAIYGRYEKTCYSINFVTAHDGFTLHDLVSYDSKKNEENGENNRDGTDYNDSWNCGVEGETFKRSILMLRNQQQKNFLLALMLSLGVPMLLMGDEYGHTRLGNNNAWCQDNSLNWFLWDRGNPALLRFLRLAIQLRKRKKQLHSDQFFTEKEVTWHGVLPYQPDWGFENRFVAFTLEEAGLYIPFNAHFLSCDVIFPPLHERRWHLLVDTSLPSPFDFSEDPTQQPALPESYHLLPHTALIAEALMMK